jgi:hypothetical protein
MRCKKAAMELSIGTIVILVIAVIMLILGIIFVRSIMCTGIQFGEEVGTGVTNEIRSLFGADRYGVKCMGEGDQEIKLASGGRRRVICVIKEEDVSNYKLTTSVKSLKGASTSTVQQKWVLTSDWAGPVQPGGDGTVAPVLLLDIPRDAPTTTLEVTVDSVKDRDPATRTSHTSYIDVVPTGFFRTTIC